MCKLNRCIFFTAGIPYRRKASSDSWLYILFPLFIGWTLISGFLLVCCVLCYALLLVFRRHRYLLLSLGFIFIKVGRFTNWEIKIKTNQSEERGLCGTA